MFVGLSLFIIGVLLLAHTGNPKLFPAVLLLGSFTMPVAFVLFLYNHRHLSDLSAYTVAVTFFYGGVLGVFAAALTEPIFVHNLSPPSALKVGLIEEATKIIGVFAIASRMRHTSQMNGIILGAAAGMGFAAFESAGYSFEVFLMSRGSLSTTVGITLLRGLLSPAGHGTWTAILAAVLFRESITDHFRLDIKVLAAYLGVSSLHALWDGVPGMALALSLPSEAVLLSETGVAVAGLLTLWFLWKDAKRRQIAPRAD
ncbi:MAG: PrsW family glutamic-type intramembrane protease [Armatimonadota bacterium]